MRQISSLLGPAIETQQVLTRAAVVPVTRTFVIVASDPVKMPPPCWERRVTQCINVGGQARAVQSRRREADEPTGAMMRQGPSARSSQRRLISSRRTSCRRQRRRWLLPTGTSRSGARCQTFGQQRQRKNGADTVQRRHTEKAENARMWLCCSQRLFLRQSHPRRTTGCRQTVRGER